MLGKDENAKNLQSTNVTTKQQSENVTAVVAVSADVAADGQRPANVPVPGYGTYERRSSNDVVKKPSYRELLMDQRKGTAENSSMIRSLSELT